MADIRVAEWPRDLALVGQLLREYAKGLGVNLAFQGFEAEVAALPGKYQAPAGRLLLAWEAAEALGCIAMRPIDAHTCEMKRLYVRASARGLHLGRKLAEGICEEARAAGYKRICLDTLPSMASAQALYRSLGFVPCAPYVFNPIAGTQFLALEL